MWRSLKFDISNNNVYPPKPASLLLAKAAIKQIKPGKRILDACTGSGVVAIAIAKLVRNVSVTASDLDAQALKLTRQNAKINNVKIVVVKSDLYRAFGNSQIDVITVHPPAVPYAPGHTWGMSQGMTFATNGGYDGSRLVLRSIREARRCLVPDGKLLLLLPHWSNTKKAYEALDKYYKWTEIARLDVEFFPLVEGKSNHALIQHVKKLTKQGLIELRFKKGRAFSKVSVIEAIPKISKS